MPFSWGKWKGQTDQSEQLRDDLGKARARREQSADAIDRALEQLQRTLAERTLKTGVKKE